MVPMTRTSSYRPRHRWIITVISVVGGLALLGVVGELVLRGIIDDRIASAEADLPAGVTVTRDDTPALWQVATGQATVSVRVSPEALTDTARTATDLPELEVASEAGDLVARLPLSIAGSEQTVDVLLSVVAEGGQAVLRADTVRLAGLSMPVATLAEQLGNDQLNRLVEGVAFPEGQDRQQVEISSVRTTDAGLELGAEVAMW